MKNYTYKLYPENFKAQDGDKEGKRVEQATINFGYEGDACYVIYIDGKMNTIQFKSDLPHQRETLELSAQAHIEELEKQDTLVV